MNNTHKKKRAVDKATAFTKWCGKESEISGSAAFSDGSQQSDHVPGLSFWRSADGF